MHWFYTYSNEKREADPCCDAFIALPLGRRVPPSSAGAQRAMWMEEDEHGEGSGAAGEGEEGIAQRSPLQPRWAQNHESLVSPYI